MDQSLITEAYRSIMDATDPNCALCLKETTRREHVLCSDKCNRWHHQRFMDMPAAEYKELHDSNEDWYCPGCKSKPPNVHRPNNSCQSSSSGESEDEEDILSDLDDTIIDSQTNSYFNSGTVTLTPARILITPAPLVNQAQGWDTSLYPEPSPQTRINPLGRVVANHT